MHLLLFLTLPFKINTIVSVDDTMSADWPDREVHMPEMPDTMLEGGVSGLLNIFFPTLLLG